MPPKATKDYAIHKKQRQNEQRRLSLILIVFVLSIFSLGTLFGCFLRSSFSTPAMDTKELAPSEPPEIVTTTEPSLYSMRIESDERILDAELQGTMIEMSKKYDLPFALILAVAEQESGFNPDEVSVTDDYGIMQINICNFNWLREKGIEPLDYRGNIEAGVLMLSEAIKKHGEYNLALMAYNCGDTGAKRLWDNGTYSTEYSRTTMERYDKWNSYIKGI